jgi:thiosulfate/3-mercaptopyruvate sulfurtransferase
VEAGDNLLRHRHFTAWQAADKLRDKAQMLANIAARAEQVVDARGAAALPDGARTAPRHGRGAHSRRVQRALYPDLQRRRHLKDKAGIRAAFEDAGVDLSRPIVTSCGSGVTACVLILRCT